MESLTRGQFYGQTNRTIHLQGLTLTDTEYTHDKVDWHYHENPYFTFILQGNLLEGNKKETNHCSSGSLLFHNWQEPHYNIKPKGFARGFHIELDQDWTDKAGVDLRLLQGNICISNPDLKLILYRIFKEAKINDETTAISVEVLLLQLVEGMQSEHEMSFKNKPFWVRKLKEILHDRCTEKLSLASLSQSLNIHPVHISRDFPKHFGCGVGEYIRKLKIDKSLSLLSDRSRSLTDISFLCGFSDQSHFIRCFREIIGISPLVYRKLLFPK